LPEFVVQLPLWKATWTSFDHLIGAAEQRRGDRDAQRLGSFESDDGEGRPQLTRWRTYALAHVLADVGCCRFRQIAR
jgi:hypothetical protein